MTLKLSSKMRTIDIDENHYIFQREDGLYYFWNDVACMDQWHARNVTVFIGRQAAEEARRTIERRNPDTVLHRISITN